MLNHGELIVLNIVLKFYEETITGSNETTQVLYEGQYDLDTLCISIHACLTFLQMSDADLHNIPLYEGWIFLGVSTEGWSYWVWFWQHICIVESS